MSNLNSTPIVVVVHKGPRKNSKIQIQQFENVRVDDVINGNARKPIIPHENEILEIGVGSGFYEKYKKKYKL